MGYSVINVAEIDGAGPGGAVRFVRRALGVEAFGINWFELPPGAVGQEHNEAESGQEEVNVVVSGSGVWRVDGDEVPVRVGSFVRFDPETTLVPVAGPEGLTFIGIGVPRGNYVARGPSERPALGHLGSLRLTRVAGRVAREAARASGGPVLGLERRHRAVRARGVRRPVG
jgi:mannose-6-phosphate isomerase-like protein (cupin superfamily)